MKSRYTSAVLLLALSAFASASLAVAADPIRVLFLGDNGHHKPKDCFAALQPGLSQHGIEVTYTDKTADLNSDTLSKYDALVLYANIDSIEKSQADALLKYVADGGGFVPLHCATFCFRNVPEVVALMGAQFKRHGTGVFRTQSALPQHEVMQGFAGFESWDETYVHHLHNEANRTVLEYRVDAEGREPWTWVRTEGQGRVFYTAWGHDTRTWSNPGFQNLVERGIRWAAKRDPLEAGAFVDTRSFPVPEMTTLPTGEKPFTFTDVGNKIPNYTPSPKWGVQGEPKNMMQDPLPPAESAKRYTTPQSMQAKLWASEDHLGGKPISMNWDEAGRLWVCETIDYPNELQPQGSGRDRIRIVADTDHDGIADKFTLFAEGLSIPTTLLPYRGGVIVQDGQETVYLKDVDGDDKADLRQSLITGWALGDTHGGVSNFQYGLDNWIWGMQGYNASTPTINGEKQQGFRQGFWRFRVESDATAKADLIAGSQANSDFAAHTIAVRHVEFIRATNNNTWGLGFTEEGLVFGSTANHNPSNFMPIPNRYYEQVRGWAPQTLEMISDTHLFKPITENIRQVDHHGGYTAGAGNAIYTARKYPQAWWNRTAFVCGPTGHLVGTFVLTPDGAGFKSTSPFNLLAGDDEWQAPIMAEVGPDGYVWVLDWYNYIVQHNPTPQGFTTGKGNAYSTDLRDKKHGRIYRVVNRSNDDAADAVADNGLAGADSLDLVKALAHPTMLWRKQAQRLLVQRHDVDPAVVKALLALVADKQIDAIGLNVAAIHALWTLHGLGLVGHDSPAADVAVQGALRHPSAGARRAAIGVLGDSSADVVALTQSRVMFDADAQVKLAALLKVADLPTGIDAELVDELVDVAASSSKDRWLLDAWTSAAAKHSDKAIPELLLSAADSSMPDALVQRLTVVGEHFARSRPAADSLEIMVNAIASSKIENSVGLLAGLAKGWPKDHDVKLSEATQGKLVELFDRLPVDRQGQLVQLATAWNANALGDRLAKLSEALLEQLQDETAGDNQRIESAARIVAMQPDDAKIVKQILVAISARTSPQVSVGIIDALRGSRSAALGNALVNQAIASTPIVKAAAVRVLLSRPETTASLLESIEQGKLTMVDLQLDQRQALAEHPDRNVRAKAKALLSKSGGIPTGDRAKLLLEWQSVTEHSGNPTLGAALFKKHCAVCHRHGTEGANIGPDLTGMAVHPKKELLTHILNPNQSVEGNFRTYGVLTTDGVVVVGMLSGESRTALELIDPQGKRHTILREDIEQLNASGKSLMPEGFESQIKREEMTDLLEFLTTRGKYIPLSFSGVATVVSTKGMFSPTDDGPDRIVFPDWNPKSFHDVPFVLVDPLDGRVPNVILLYGPNGSKPPTMPKQVTLTCNAPVAAVHILGGIGGWSYPYDAKPTVSMTVRLRYADDKTEDHPLINGVHIADYIRREDVPKSEFAFNVKGQQVRYLKLIPERAESLKEIELIKGEDQTAPIVVAITVETKP